ncbi:autophagy-related protein 18h [Quercus suber]|uniref:Autophagy-related protein 18h n=1 Tax=Quercus suber TaxID=58331 RepID=A0AAW0L437_QUESU
MEAQLKFVNSYKDSLKMETHFKDEVDRKELEAQATQLHVIIKDIISKVVIAQFRAYKSPISALCFDPSGTT